MLAKYDHVLVEFYAPWCGHCKTLAPEYSQAAAILKKSDPAIPLVKVDATVEKDLGTKYGVQGFPTLKLFVKGQDSEYKGGRVKQEIVDWVVKKTGPSSKNLANAEALKDAKTENRVMVVYFGTADDSRLATFMSVSQTVEGVTFAHTHDEALVAEHGHKVMLFKQFDEGQNELEGAVTSESLTKFVEDNRYELVMIFEGEEPIQRIFQQENSALILFSDKTGEHEVEFRALAAANKGRIVYSVSRTNDGLGQRLAEYVGVKSEEAPCVRLVQPAGGDLSKFVYSGDLTQVALEAFLTKFENGGLDRSFKSSEVPATNDEPVKVVVGKNFADLVTNSNKDVLLEFYAPWCGHCKTLAPKYAEAATKLLHLSDKLTLAMIDATENEIEGVSVQGFPTLKFFKAGNPTPIEYDGERETEGIVAWLKKNVSFEWTDAAATETDL